MKGLNWRDGGVWWRSEGKGGGERRLNGMFAGVWSEGFSGRRSFAQRFLSVSVERIGV